MSMKDMGRKAYEKSPMDKGGKMKGAKPAKAKAKASGEGGNVVTGRAKSFKC